MVMWVKPASSLSVPTLEMVGKSKAILSSILLVVEQVGDGSRCWGCSLIVLQESPS